jgi:hypothetical protein
MLSIDDSQRVCKHCGIAQPLDQFPLRKDYHAWQCRTCKSVYEREWRQCNPTANVARRERYRETHREQIRASDRRRLATRKAQRVGQSLQPRRHHAVDPATRFWSKVDKSGECWIWTDHCDPNGYGRFWNGKRGEYAHRFAWEQEHGPIPPGKEVCHDCPGGDNPSCVRHLWLGTHADNMADRDRKKRLESRARGI